MSMPTYKTLPFVDLQAAQLPKYDPSSPLEKMQFAFDTTVVYSGRRELQVSLELFTAESTAQVLEAIYPGMYSAEEKEQIFADIKFIRENLQQPDSAILPDGTLINGKPIKDGKPLRTTTKKAAPPPAVEQQADFVDAHQPIITLIGHPIALALVQASASCVLGSMTAFATHARELVDLAPGVGGFASFGKRRLDNPGFPDYLDLACFDGGIILAADILAAAKANPQREPNQTPTITGTAAHLATNQTSIYVRLLEKHLAGSEHKSRLPYIQAMGLDEAAFEDFKKSAGLDKDELDFEDFITFACIFNGAIEEAESAGKPQDMRRIVALVDTTDSLLGTKTAIRVTRELNKGRSKDGLRPLTGIRLDTEPIKYLKDAWELIKKAAAEDPALFGKTQIFMTDGLDAAQITTILKMADEIGIPRSLLVFGIGSALANTHPNIPQVRRMSLTLAEEEAVKTKRVTTAKTEDDVKLKQSATHFDTMPFGADFYTFTMYYQIFKRYNESLPNDSPHIDRITQAIHFRFRKGVPNHMIMFGAQTANNLLKDFVFTQELVDILKGTPLFLDPISGSQALQELVGKKIEVRVAGMQDGQVGRPYQVMYYVNGNQLDASVVEAALLSIIAASSAVATATESIISSSGYSYTELDKGKGTDSDYFLLQACNLYVLDVPEESKDYEIEQLIVDIKAGKKKIPLNTDLRQKLIDYLYQNYAPQFSYCGGPNQRTATASRAIAACVGGCTETTMVTAEGIPITYQRGMNYKKYLALSPSERKQVSNIHLHLDFAIMPEAQFAELAQKLKDIRSQDPNLSFTFEGPLGEPPGSDKHPLAEETMRKVRDMLAFAGIPGQKWKYMLGEPIAAVENAKGVVFKLSAARIADDIFYCLKAAGSVGKPGVKTSISGDKLIEVELRDAANQVIGVMKFDLAKVAPGLENTPANKAEIQKILLAEIKNGQVIMHFDDPDGAAHFGEEPAKKFLDRIEHVAIITTPEIDTKVDQTPKPLDWAAIRAARAKARQGMRKDRIHTLPTFIHKPLYTEMLKLMPKSSRGPSHVISNTR